MQEVSAKKQAPESFAPVSKSKGYGLTRATTTTAAAAAAAAAAATAAATTATTSLILDGVLQTRACFVQAV